MPQTTQAGYTEAIELEGEAIEIGRDPRKMTVAQLNTAGHAKRPLLDAVRANCIACCAGNAAEVRRCRMIQCDMWPYRMATNPFARKDLSDEARQALREGMAARMAGRRGTKEDAVTVEGDASC